MDNDKQIVHYLEELAKVLTDLQVTNPFHILITGGAYMLKKGAGRMITHEEQRATLESTDTGKTSRVRLQTFRCSFEEICAGEAPWIPLGKFMHQFFGCFNK